MTEPSPMMNSSPVQPTYGDANSHSATPILAVGHLEYTAVNSQSFLNYATVDHPQPQSNYVAAFPPPGFLNYNAANSQVESNLNYAVANPQVARSNYAAANSNYVTMELTYVVNHSQPPLPTS